MAGKVFKVTARFVADDKASPTIKKLRKSQQDLEKEIERLGKAFRKGDISVDNYTKALDDAEKEQKKLDKALKASGSVVETTGSKISKFASGVKANFLAIAAASAGLVAGFKLVQDAAEKVGQRRAFENSIEDADSFLKKLREVSNAQISNADLILATNRALKLGLEQAAIPELLDVAARASVQLGTSVTEAFSDITKGVGRGSALILDNLGIIVDVTAANKTYAVAIGKTVEALTAKERTISVQNAVLAQGSKAVGNFSENQDKLTKTINQVGASMKNLAVAVGEATGKVLSMVAPSGDLADSLQATADALPDTVEGFELWVKAMREADTELTVVQSVLGGLIDKFESFGGILSTTDGLTTDHVKNLRELHKTFADLARIERERVAAIAREEEELTELNRQYLENADALAVLLGVEVKSTKSIQDQIDARKRLRQELDEDATAFQRLADAIGVTTSAELELELAQLEADLRRVRGATGEVAVEFQSWEQAVIEKIERTGARIDSLKNGMGDLAPVLDVVTNGFMRGATAADAEAIAIGRLTGRVIELIVQENELTQAQERRLNLAGGLVGPSGRPLTQAQQRRLRLGSAGTFTGFDISGGTFTTITGVQIDENGNIIG